MTIKNRAIAGAIIGTLSTILLGTLIYTQTFQNWHLKVANTLYTRDNPSSDIVIIAIDEETNRDEPIGLGKYSQWSRNHFSQALENLQNADPQVIAFDIVFNRNTSELPFDEIKKFVYTEKNKDYEEFLSGYMRDYDNIIDNNFADTLSQYSNIILAFKEGVNRPSFPLSIFMKSTKLGFLNVALDSDGYMRKTIPYFEYEEEVYDSLAIAAVRQYLDAEPLSQEDIFEDSITLKSDKKDIDIPIEDNRLNVNYFADPFGQDQVSFKDIYYDKFDPKDIEGKIAIIGLTYFYDGPHDAALTPKDRRFPMPGVEIHANQIQTILEEKFLTNQSEFGQLATVASIAIALTIALNYVGILLSIIIAIAAIFAYILAAHISYRQGLIINMVYPFMAILLSYLGSWIYKYFIADKGKRDITSAFGHYVSDKLVEQISKNPDMVKLGGEKRLITVFFSDIKDSTAHSENTEIGAWVSQINEYFTVMEQVIKKYDGTIDKYEGDAIMGFWNAPISQENHVVLAYGAALEMRAMLVKLNEKWVKEGRPEIEFRIGINTGEAIVGNFGSKNRFDYTAMGDTVNTASRLESSANKTYGTGIVVAGGEAEGFITRELDTVLLPGKSEPVKIYELICRAEEETGGIRGMCNAYETGLEAYRKGDFAAAIKSFGAIQNDSASKIMLERCERLQKREQVSGVQGDMTFKIAHK